MTLDPSPSPKRPSGACNEELASAENELHAWCFTPRKKWGAVILDANNFHVVRAQEVQQKPTKFAN
jgi:hypothetical protein